MIQSAESVDKLLRPIRTAGAVSSCTMSARALRGHMPITPLLKRATDIAIILAVSAAIAFVIIAGANSLVAKTGIWKSYAVWMGFITRPDIIVTSMLAIIVTMAVSNYHSGKR